MDGNVNNFDEQNEQPFLNDKDDEQLESLSLRDLPIIIPTTTPTVSSRSSSTTDLTSDFFFEFLINNDDDIITSTADDVIFHGRLLPYAPPPPRRSLSLSSAAARLTRPQFTESPSESSSSLPAFRPSRSLNCRKLHRSSHHQHYSKSKPKPKPKVDMIHSNCNSDDKAPAAKLPWYWLVFGLPVKIAAEMELKDIKSRQFRRELTSPVERQVSGDRSCSAVSWKFLSVLSCKSHASVDVNNTAPLRNSLMF